MKSKKLCLIIAAVMLAGTFATGCKSNEPAPVSSNAGTDSGDSGKLEPYTFTHYYNYDWWGIKPWAQDAVSQELQKKFNVTINFQKPDSDPAAKLNVMISSGDLPDSIMMDRGVDNVKLATMGLLQPLEPLMEKNPAMKENLHPNTLKLLQIEGKVYGIPNWPRTKPTGGNDTWITEDKVYKTVGSPKLDTFEDLYNYAKKVKEANLKNSKGQSVYPVLFESSTDGSYVADAFYRSFGGYLNGWYSVVDGKYVLAFRDPKFKQASMEINKWWREGLLSETQFTDTGDQIVEKLSNGRVGLMHYDASKDDTNHFRRTLMQSDPSDGYTITPFPYPPANGLSKDKIYGDIQGTVGWNVTCITKNAKNPQRIYDVISYLLTKDAAVLQMYGPKGQMWDELDANGLPKLKKPESSFTTDEINKLGLWFWMEPGQSDHVDSIKFAVNAAQPKENRSWVISNQSDILTPTLLLSDEFVGIAETIDSKDDNGIKRTLVEDYVKANYPKMLMAKTEAEAAAIYDDINAFADKNGMPKIEEIYNNKYQQNVKDFGTVFKK